MIRIKRKPEMIRMKRLDFADCAPGPGVFVLFPPVARSLMNRAATQSQQKVDKHWISPNQQKLKPKQNQHHT
jgi:hypothetical protein